MRLKKWYVYRIQKYLLPFLFIMILLPSYAQKKSQKAFNFFAFGDMPYGSTTDEERFIKLMDSLNKQDQVFNIHVGDVKSGKSICSDEYYIKILNYFNQFNKPLIFTPGDNDWTDCCRKACGSYNSEERLSLIRKIFFTEEKSFGKEPISLISQRSNPQYAKYVENYRWDYNSITFSTIHVVGSNNNFSADSGANNLEFYERDLANKNWLNETFGQAKVNNSLGIVIIIHADMFTGTDEKTGFKNFLNELQNLTSDFKKPVLLINGDSHKFIVDKPIFTKPSKSLKNFTRVQVFGEQDVNAVKIVVNPSNPDLFEVYPIIIKN